jgi:hypothetical protein
VRKVVTTIDSTFGTGSKPTALGSSKYLQASTQWGGSSLDNSTRIGTHPIVIKIRKEHWKNFQV